MNDCLRNVKLFVASEYGLVVEFGTVISLNQYAATNN